MPTRAVTAESRQVDLRPAGDEAEGVVETPGVSGGEQLLGVGGAARTAHVHGHGEVGVDQPVGGADPAGAAGTGGGGLRGVEDVHVVHLSGVCWVRASVRATRVPRRAARSLCDMPVRGGEGDGNLAGLAAELGAVLGQADDDGSLVGRVATPGDEPGGLETLEERRQRAGVEPERLAEIFDGGLPALPEHEQDEVLRIGQAQWLEQGPVRCS